MKNYSKLVAKIEVVIKRKMSKKNADTTMYVIHMTTYSTAVTIWNQFVIPKHKKKVKIPVFAGVRS
jgi:hypothetical protein